MTVLEEYLSPENIKTLTNIALTIVVGFALVKTATFLAKKFIWKSLSQQSKLLVSKIIHYLGMFIIIFIVLKHLGISLTTLLSAAGIISVVIGFASQTSMSNVISGIFIITEKAFEIGDLIRVGDKTGILYSIDLLSIKLRTLDNTLIRIPNQTILSTEVTNITKFPIRRMDIDISVAYREDLEKVTDLLKKIAREAPLALDEPEPLIIIKTFGASGIDLLLGLWFEKSNFLTLKNHVMKKLKEEFDSAGIEIPFPHMTIYSGSETQPFPIATKAN